MKLEHVCLLCIAWIVFIEVMLDRKMDEADRLRAELAAERATIERCDWSCPTERRLETNELSRQIGVYQEIVAGRLRLECPTTE